MKAVMEITSFDKNGKEIGSIQVDRRLTLLTKGGYLPIYLCRALRNHLNCVEAKGGAVKLEFRLV